MLTASAGAPRSASTLTSLPALAAAMAISLVLAGALRAQSSKGPIDISPRKELDIPEPKNDPRAEEVIERYLAALGGRDTLAAITDKTVVFETVKHAPAGVTKADLKLFLKRGYKIREEWDLPGFKISDKKLQFVQVYNGFDGWVQMFGTVSALEGRTLSIFVWDKPIDDFFMHWKEDGYSVAYLEESQFNGEPVDVIQTIDFHGKNKVRYFFSKKSGLLLKKEWRDQDQKGFVTKSNQFLRYRAIPFKSDPSKKVQVALHQKIFVGKDLDTERIIKEVAFNTGLRDAIFERPEGVEFTGGIGRGAKHGGPSPREIFEKFKGGGGTKGAAAKKPAPVKVPKPVKVPASSKN